MDAVRGDRSRGAGLVVPIAIVVLIAMTMLLAGCAPSSREPVVGSSEASPTPTAACPQIEGIDLPPECAPYDPEHAMAQNDRHHQRMDASGESSAAADVVDEVRTELEVLRASGTLSVQAVEAVLTQAGLEFPQVQGDDRSVDFGVDAPAGGCIFGAVSVDHGVSVDVGGYVLDGGCLAQDGH